MLDMLWPVVQLNHIIGLYTPIHCFVDRCCTLILSALLSNTVAIALPDNRMHAQHIGSLGCHIYHAQPKGTSVNQSVYSFGFTVCDLLCLGGGMGVVLGLRCVLQGVHRGTQLNRCGDKLNSS